MTDLPESVSDRLRDTLREDLQAQLGDLCVQRGFAAPEQIRGAVEEQARLRGGGESLSLLQVMLRMKFLTTQQYLGMVEGLGETTAEPRQRLGRYELLKVIGKGGIGTVYKAFDTPLRRIVALKTLRTDIAPAGIVASRLVREAQATARLRHANIVIVHDTGEIDGVPYIAMEFVEGTHLGEVLKQKTLGIDAIVAVLAKAAVAVGYAHAQGIVHRDLKPGNIIVRSNGEPSIIDFGLARILDPGEAKALTQSAIGTPFYMSPEQVRDSKSAGPPTDIYALGVTLYEAMTGRAPFDGATHFELFQKILSEEPVPPRAIRPELSPDLETICLVALAKDPSCRYASAADFAADLERYLKHEPIAAKPPSMAQRVGRRLARYAVRIASVAAVTALLVAAAFWWRRDQRSRAFDQAGASARTAFAAGEWSKALFEIERALEMSVDAELSKLAIDCRAKIAAQSEDAAKLGRYRSLQERLKPFDAAIRETRSFFYIKDADIRAKLAKLEETLAALERMAQSAESEGFPDAWSALGIGWYTVGDFAKAERALLKAEAIAPADGPANVYLGRICLERATAELMAEDRTHAAELQARARTYFDVKTGWGGADEIDRQIAEAYRALANRHGTEVARLCDDGLKRFAAELGAEAFWYLKSWTLTGEERVRCLDRALERRPHYAWAYLSRGTARYEAADYDGAIADYDQALAANPRLAYAHNDRGVALYKKGDAEGAVAAYSRAIEIDPVYVLALLNRSVALTGLGRHVEALADADAAIAKQSSSRAFTNRGAARYAKKDFEGAAADFSRAIDLDGSNAMAYANRGMTRASQRDAKRALADFTAAIRLDATMAAAFAGRAGVRQSQGDLAGAQADFEANARLLPRSATALTLLASVRIDRGDLDGAVADLTRALELDARCVAAIFYRGTIHLERNDLAAALADFEEALRLGPYAPALASRGMVRETQGRLDEAIADYDAALRLDPTYAEAFVNRGIARIAKGEPEKAFDDFGAAIELGSRNALAFHHRGNLLKARGETGSAESNYTSAIELEPKLGDAYAARGTIRLARQDFDGAIADLTKAVEFSPSAEVYTNRGAARANQADYAGAAKDFERALEIAPKEWAYRAHVESMLKQARERK